MDRDRSRGQLLLVAGLGIAVTLVTLAVVLNAAIYTENLATRDTVPGQEAVSFERTAEEGTGGLLSLVNYHDNDDYAMLHQQLASEVRTWDNKTSLHGASYGVIRGASLVGVEDGTQIIQDTDRAFTDDDDTEDWTLATNVTSTRRFRLNTSRSSLAGSTSGAFEVVVTNGSQEWTATVYESGSNVTVALSGTAYGGSGPSYGVAGEHVEIDLTQGAVGGREHPGFVFAEGVTPPYDVSYRNGNQATGQYVALVDRPRVPLLSDLPEDVYHDRSSDLSPYTVPAVYSANISVTYERPDLTYTSTVTVAPKRPPGGESYTVGGEAFARELVFAANTTGRLSSINVSGNVTRYTPTDVQAIGPKELDLDGDGLREIPYVTASNTLKLVDEQNRTQTLATDAATANTLVGVGTWRGETGVFYVNTSDGVIYRAAPGADPQKVLVDGNGVEAGAVAGIADYNQDGDADLVYTGTSQNVWYVDGDQTHDVGRNVGQNLGIGVGAPRTFNGGIGMRAPIIDGSSNVGLLSYANDKNALTSTGQAEKTPVAGIDWNQDADLETVFVHADTNTLHYVTLNETVTQLTDADGDPIRPKQGPGVA